MKISILGVTLLLLVSCATTQLYEGPKRPDSEVVIIKSAGSTEYSVVVCQIDGENLSPCKSEIEILPGEHTLKLELVKSEATFQTSYNKKLFRAGDRYLMGPGSVSGGSQPRLKFWREKNINEE